MGLLFDSCVHDATAFLVVLISIAALYVRHQFGYWQRRGIPYVKSTFPFGNFGDHIMQRTSQGELTQKLYSSTSEPVLGIFSMIKPLLFVNDPDLIREVLIKDFARFQDRGTYCDPKNDPLSGHLFALAGDNWRNLRNKLTPAFTSGKLKAMFGAIVECGAPLHQFLDKAAKGGEVVEMRELIAQYTTNIIASTAFGLEIDSIADPETPFRKNGRKVMQPSAWNPFLEALFEIYPGLLQMLGIKSVEADVEEFFMSTVRQNLEHREKNNVVRKDFFQLLVQLRNGGVLADGEWHSRVGASQQLSVEECAAQTFVFFLAGFETSSTTVSFALYELAKNPEVQRRVQREIDEVLARHGGEVTYESVSEMKYLDWCLDETLRKYPPVVALNRICMRDWHIPNTNMVVEKGTVIWIPAYALQNDPKYYPEPERFLPERFDRTHEAFTANRPYLPFGDGPRNCIGMRFGKMQSKVGMVCVLREFWCELAGNTKLPLVLDPASIALAPVGGVHLRVSRREQ